MSPWLWIAAGILLSAVEMVLPGVYLLWIGIGGAVTGLVLLAMPGLSLETQLVLFAVLAVAASVAGAAVYRRISKSDTPRLNRRSEQLLGRVVTLDEAIRDGVGRARVGDGVWRVEGPDLPAGARVRIVGAQGAVLHVVAEGAPS